MAFFYVIVFVSAAVSVFVSAFLLRRIYNIIVAYVQQHFFFCHTQYAVEVHTAALCAVIVLAYVWNQDCD